MTRATKLVLATLILGGGYGGARIFPRTDRSAPEKDPIVGVQSARDAEQDGRSPGPDAVAATGTSRADRDHGHPPTVARDLRPTYAARGTPPPNHAAAHPTSGTTSLRPTPPPRRTHRIVDGDTLAHLAERYLGDDGRAEEIFQLNRELLPSPKILPIGVVLQLPPRHRPAVPEATVAAPAESVVADSPAAPTLLPARPTEPHVTDDGDSEQPDDLVPIPPGLFRRRNG